MLPIEGKFADTWRAVCTVGETETVLADGASAAKCYAVLVAATVLLAEAT